MADAPAPGRTDVLVFVEDPGPANHPPPVVPALAGRGLGARLLAAGAATAYLRERGVPCEEVPADAAAREVIGAAAPRIVLTGTSENPDTLGLALIDQARRAGIESVGLVDGRPNSGHRFRGRGGGPLHHAPDWVLVPDSWTREDYLRLGFEGARLVVCGHPHYDTVREAGAGLEREGRAAVRRRLFGRGPAGRPVVVFAAELSTGLDPGQFRRSAAYTLSGRGRAEGRTEIVVEELLDAADRLEERPYLVLRLHPKNTRAELAEYLPGFDAVSQGGSALEVAFAADLVVGMTSQILLDAALLGRPTLSVVPSAAERDWLPTIGSGVTPCATTREELDGLLARMLAAPGGEAPARAAADFVPGAAECVAAFVQERLSRTEGQR